MSDQPTAPTPPSYLVLGRIMRPHGIRGEVRMSVMTDYPQRLLSEIKTVYLGSDPQQPVTPYEIASARFHKDALLLKFATIPDRNAAESLRDLLVMIDIAHAVPLEDDEFYLYQLIGLTVVTTQGQSLGTISEVLETGANDVYIIHGEAYGELLIPAHDETLVRIDFDQQQVIMDLPEGLLPSDPA